MTAVARFLCEEIAELAFFKWAALHSLLFDSGLDFGMVVGARDGLGRRKCVDLSFLFLG